MDIAAYIRVSTDDQDEGRQRDSIIREYGDHDIDWYVDIGESGSKVSREQYQQLRDNVDQHDVVVAHDLDRLGRSFAELADFVQQLREDDVGLDLVNQPIGTVGEDDWMQDAMLNMMIVFADVERKMIQTRVQEGIDRAREEGKRVGRPPFGFEVEDGFLQQIPHEYVRAQNFIREVRKGRQKKATAEFFEIPESTRQSILDRSEENYDVEFDNSKWRLEREKVRSGEKELEPLSEIHGEE